MTDTKVTKKTGRGGRRRRNEHGIPEEILDQLLADYRRPEDLTSSDGLLTKLKKALIERAPGAARSDVQVRAPPRVPLALMVVGGNCGSAR